MRHGIALLLVLPAVFVMGWRPEPGADLPTPTPWVPWATDTPHFPTPDWRETLEVERATATIEAGIRQSWQEYGLEQATALAQCQADLRALATPTASPMWPEP